MKVVFILLSIIIYFILNHYRKHITILLNEELKIEANSRLSIYNNLKKSNIFLPSSCGGEGTCGYCKIKVKEASPPSCSEKELIDENQIKEGYRLACQTYTDKNIEIYIKADLLNLNNHKVKIMEKEYLSEEIVKLTLYLNGRTINFKPGQYIQLGVDLNKVLKKESNDFSNPIYRAYSIASSNSIVSTIELIISKGKLVSSYLYEDSSLEEEFSLYGPYGESIYQGKKEKIVLMASGSGYAPVRSILFYILENKIDKEIEFYFFQPFDKALYFKREIDFFEKEIIKLSFTQIFYNNQVGCIDNFFNNIDEDRYKDISEIYIFSNPFLVNKLVLNWENKGIHKDNIYFDF